MYLAIKKGKQELTQKLKLAIQLEMQVLTEFYLVKAETNNKPIVASVGITSISNRGL